jgi:Glycosyl transferase family 2
MVFFSLNPHKLVNFMCPFNTHNFHSFIDEPLEPNLSSTRVIIRGWCYDREGHAITSIRARIGSVCYIGVYGILRSDVKEAFGDVAGELSGFEIAVIASINRSYIIIEVELQHEWHQLRTIEAAPPSNQFRNRARWGWNWIKAWFGYPIWSHLSNAERKFLMVWAKQNRLLTVGVWNQYPPREVLYESFPKPRIAISSLPKVSIVTPSFNQGRFLEQTICSVLDQVGVRIDYIVQDGGSTDGSVEIIKRYTDRLTAWESAPDSGQASAIVQGFQKSVSGPNDIMGYLNSDDLLLPCAVRFVAEYFARNPTVDVIYGHRILIDSNDHEIGRWVTPRQSCNDIRMHDLVPQETLFWRKRIWDRINGIDQDYQFALDWDLILRFQDVGAKFTRIPWFLGCFRIHPNQKSWAWYEKFGELEMNDLRRRSLCRTPTQEELQSSMEQAQFDSAIVYALKEKGFRV